VIQLTIFLRRSHTQPDTQAHKDLAPRSTPTQLPIRRNVFDDDEFDRLAVDTTKISFGKNPEKTADDVLRDKSTAPNKATMSVTTPTMPPTWEAPWMQATRKPMVSTIATRSFSSALSRRILGSLQEMQRRGGALHAQNCEMKQAWLTRPSKDGQSCCREILPR
jgi:hypothetical protein